MNRRKYKFKKHRSLLCNVTGNKRSSFEKRPYTPGSHPKKIFLMQKLHSELLINKQRILAFFSNIKDYQLRNIVKKHYVKKNYEKIMIDELESRIDTLLYRSGICSSMQQARQWINHRFFLDININNIKIDNNGNIANKHKYIIKCPSYKIKDNNYIIINSSKFKKILPLIMHNLNNQIDSLLEHIKLNDLTNNIKGKQINDQDTKDENIKKIFEIYDEEYNRIKNSEINDNNENITNYINNIIGFKYVKKDLMKEFTLSTTINNKWSIFNLNKLILYYKL